MAVNDGRLVGGVRLGTLRAQIPKLEAVITLVETMAPGRTTRESDMRAEAMGHMRLALEALRGVVAEADEAEGL